MAELVVGVAEARPKGFSNLSPHISTLMSTRSTGVKNLGREGSGGTYRPWRDWGGGEGRGRGGGREEGREGRKILVALHTMLVMTRCTWWIGIVVFKS